MNTSTSLPANLKPSVAHLLPFFYPRLGGLENVARELAKVQSQSRPVTVVTTTCGAPDAARREVLDGIEVRRHPGLEIFHTPVSLAMAADIFRLTDDTIVHAHLAQAFLPEVLLLRRALLNRGYFVHYHMEVDESGPAGFLLGPYKKLVLGPALRRATGVFVLVDEQREFLTENYRVSRERIRVLPNGVDVARFQTSLVRERSDGPLRLLFVGRLEAQKNIPRLLESIAATTEPVTLRIVGDGELRPRMTALALKLGVSDRVEFVGRRSGEDLVTEYNLAEALVLSSDREGMPLVVLEALAAGLPVVAGDCDGMTELVADAGLVVPLRPQDIGTAIDELAANPDRYRELAANARERGGAMSWQAQVDLLERYYSELT